MLRNRKNAMAQEEGYHWLLPRVGEFVEPLLAGLETEDEPRMQGWILELLGEAGDVRAFPAFARHLFSPDESVRWWAQSGLRKLGETREGRKVLWDVYRQQKELPQMSDERHEHHMHEVLAGILNERHPF
jgi:HEAT repeat protein